MESSVSRNESENHYENVHNENSHEENSHNKKIIILIMRILIMRFYRYDNESYSHNENFSL